MCFLIKNIFWLSLALIILSIFSTENPAKTAIDASSEMTSAISAAAGVISYARNFCTEKPEICNQGTQALSSLKKRTLKGAQAAYELINSKSDENKTETTKSTKIHNKISKITATDSIPIPKHRPYS